MQMTPDTQGDVETAVSEEVVCENVLDHLLATLHEDVESSRGDGAAPQAEVASHGQPAAPVTAWPPADVNQSKSEGVTDNVTQIEAHPWRGRRQCWKIALCWVAHHLIQALAALLVQFVPGVHWIGGMVLDVVTCVQLMTGVEEYVPIFLVVGPDDPQDEQGKPRHHGVGLDRARTVLCLRARGRMRRRAAWRRMRRRTPTMA